MYFILSLYMNPASFEVFITQLSFKKNNEYTSVKVFLKD